VDRAIDPNYLTYQYGTTDRLRARLDAHQRFSEHEEDFFDWVLDRLNPRPGDLVLDVACGPGVYHPRLCGRGVRAVLGVDASPGMVETCQRQANDRGLPVLVICGDAQALPVPHAAYDCVMANHMLFHVPDQRAALGELRRALKPGGRVVMTTTDRRDTSRLMSLHRQAAKQLGWVAAAAVVDRFNLDHIDFVREIFPDAERFVREDAFRFPSTDAVLRYYASGLIDAIMDAPTDGSHREKLLRVMAEPTPPPPPPARPAEHP
jgi:ubiquinone/menaquinone biosynthesis C-methylase UbiE